MSSPTKEIEEPTSTNDLANNDAGSPGEAEAAAPSEEAAPSDEPPRPPAKRRLSSTVNTVIEISDTESDDSDVCAVTSYQASADEVKRIRGADYSSTSSSSSDYSSDSESPWEDDSVVVQEAPRTRPPCATLNPRADRMTDPKLNPAIQSQELIDKLTTHWKEKKEYSSDEITLTCEPFRLCLLHELLANADIINNIVDDMNTLDWSRKKMDLYEFHQTADLASLTWQRGIKGIYELLKTEVMSWVSKVTGVELTSISASCSLYGPGDHLLVHDDLLGDRRVAFILYLAPWAPRHASYSAGGSLENGGGDHKEVEQIDVEACGWAAHMGGALQLLGRDGSGWPTDVEHTVYPRNNMLAFFQVGPETFHQVDEVLSLELPRLSINGWFHGPAPPDPAPPPPPLPAPEIFTQHNEVVLLNQWVESTYMSARARAQIQAQMERESEVCLPALLPPARRDQLLAALAHPDVPWERVGPADQRRYERVAGITGAAGAAGAAGGEGVEVVEPLHELARVLASSAWARLLHDCTDLTVSHYERLEIQRWAPGDYTLLPPRELYQQARLEAVLYLGVPTRAICGGATSYVAPEEAAPPHEGALVSLPPQDNALNLVYCDAGAASFTKYVSKITMRPHQRFYIITCTYRE